MYCIIDHMSIVMKYYETLLNVYVCLVSCAMYSLGFKLILFVHVVGSLEFRPES